MGVRLRVLLTGFRPFGGEPLNPSERLVRALASAPPPHAGLLLRGVILPVDRGRYRPALAAAVRRHRPQLVLGIGQATGRARFELESLAVNAIDYGGRLDNGGNAAGGEPLRPGGPARLAATLPVDDLAARLVAEGLPAAVSRDAGRHLCNALLYEMLDVHAALPAAFVHVPLLPEQAARRATGEPALPLAVSLRCLSRLLVLLAEPRRGRS